MEEIEQALRDIIPVLESVLVQREMEFSASKKCECIWGLCPQTPGVFKE